MAQFLGVRSLTPFANKLVDQNKAEVELVQLQPRSISFTAEGWEFWRAVCAYLRKFKKRIG